MKKIKKGYLIEVTSWENDGDNYKTETLEGLSASEAEFYAEVCALFHSDYGRGNPGKYGNTNIEEYCEGETSGLVLDLTELAMKHELSVEDYAHEDLVDDLIGCWNDGEYYRVCESIKAFYNPFDVVMAEVKFS